MKSCWFPTVLALLAFTCDDASDAPDDISVVCQRQARCQDTSDGPSEFDEGECRDQLSAGYDEASGYGCSATYTDWIKCQATEPVDCPPAPQGNLIEHSSESANPCQGAYDAFRRCQAKANRDECVVVTAGGAGGCLISCTLFTGDCSAPASTSEDSSCVCQAGEKVGGTFSGRCGADSLETSARGACQ